MPPQVVCQIAASSDVGTARRQAVRVATHAFADETLRGRVAVIATELGTNLASHGGGGQLLFQVLEVGDAKAVEVLAIDSGPGMADPEQCVRDGYSTGGTPGNGIGAVKRLSEEFDVYSQVGKGTVVMARVHAAPVLAGIWRWGVISTPAPGETAVGDSWRLSRSDNAVRIMVADGLGHGPFASEAAEAAAQVFQSAAYAGLKPFLERAHVALRHTRGAAVAVAACDIGSERLTYAGVGNIAGVILTHGGATRGLMSHNGTVGAEMRTVQEMPYEWSVGDRLIMHSDGIASRWRLGEYPGLALRHPALSCAILYRDYLRGRDDATVLVLERAA